MFPSISQALLRHRATTVDRKAALQGLRSRLDANVYTPFGYLLGLLPSLGFIGTVLGMGEALLRADGLFTSPDKQASISSVTQHLGYAFDTTLLALLASLAVSLLFIHQRWHEMEFLEQRSRQEEIRREPRSEGSGA